MATEFPEATARAIRGCAEWLHSCLSLGWPKSSLDELEALWWKYHDRYGNLVRDSRAALHPQPEEMKS